MVMDVHAHLIPRSLLSGEKALRLSYDPDHRTVVVGGHRVSPVGEDMFDPGRQLESMDEEGIGLRVLSIPPFIFVYRLKPEDAVAWARQANEGLAEACGRGTRFLGLGTVPLQDPRSAIEELRYCVERLRFAGVEIGTNVAGEDLDSPRFEPFFHACDELACAVLVHPGDVLCPERLNRFYLQNILGNPFETAIAAARLALTGRLQQYAKMRVCLSHGGGALPALLGRAARAAEVRPELQGRQLSPGPNVLYDTVVHDEATLKFLADKCGLANVVLGTDYPFDMGDPHPVRRVNSLFEEEDCRLVTCANPRRFLYGGTAV